MAIKKEIPKVKPSSKLMKHMANIQTNMDKLYQNTFFTKPTNLKDLTNMKSNIDRSIDNIITNNLNNAGVPNISKLYSRAGSSLDSVQKDKSIAKDISTLFDDRAMMDNILASYMENKYLKDLDTEIDVVCKYMPKLLEALDTRKDNVLSSDHFSKDFINITNDSNIDSSISFSEKIANMKKTYNLAELFETTYDNAAKYGEQFIYIVPYKKALAKLLATKGGTVSSKVQMESLKIISESGGVFDMEPLPSNMADAFKEKKYNINIEINQSNMINSVIEASVHARNKYSSIVECSVSSFNESKSSDIGKSITGDLDYSDFEKASSTDGLITPNSTKDKLPTVNTPGCIVKTLDRSTIIPIYIEDLCLGYYYLEFKEQDDFNNMSVTDPVMGMKTSPKSITKDNEMKQDQMLKYISGQLSSFIDSKFINQNQDLRKEIYMILKHNDIYNTPSADKIKVTFLPAEDVVHVYFRKDKKTNRGISDLARALLAAKLYSSLYITNSLAVMTRGQDKRVYYVKQNIDTNISKVLLNTIEQIKKSNFGIRQIENMNNILNITGRFNDYVIPVGPNGDYPVQFEVMPGQNVEIKTELMNILEEMAINSTDVPLELIQARQSIDYALQLTMTNSKFLRKVYNRQSRCQDYFSDIVTKIYNAEYETDDELTVMLPPPMFLNITNTNQIMDNTNQLVQSVVASEMADETDEQLKMIFSRKLMRHYLSSYLDIHNIELLKIAAKHELSLKKLETPPE